MAQHLGIGGEQREALIGNLALLAEAPYLAVPTEPRVTAVLHKFGRLGMRGRHLLKMLKRNIADPKETRAASIALLNHGLPDLVVRTGPAVAGSGTVQHEAIDVLSPKMFERTGHGLRRL